jgi:hypothetical protein
MKAKAAFYFFILCRQLLSLERYRRKKGFEVKVHCRTYGVLRYINCEERTIDIEKAHSLVRKTAARGKSGAAVYHTPSVANSLCPPPPCSG